ncbi:hypothetical protein HY622_04430 [Candidatus Uhrbacteria bacterium]|nr:hypothetical protein [Candidatus Uhrbacteria bacterium]
MEVGKEVTLFGVRFIPLKVWNIDNHAVAWVQVEDDRKAAHLVCDCDFRDQDKPYTYGGADDPNSCPAKKTVEQERVQKTQRFYTEVLKTRSLEEVIEEIFRRVYEKKEFLGQRRDIVYAQEIAVMVLRPLQEVLAALETLYAQDKIELYGMILIPFRHRFQFPREIQSLLRFMIEEPLGWPNGDAGDCFVGDIERAIDAGTHFKHGREAFGDGGNWPRLRPDIKALFGSQWLAEAMMSYMVRAAQGDEKAQGKLDEIAAFLQKWIDQIMTGRAHEI